MNKRFTGERASFVAFMVCFFSYIFISLTRNALPAAKASMIAEGVFTKTDAGLVDASYYLFYGSTTFLGGYFADRISPFVLIFVSLLGSVLSCVIMFFSSSLLLMVIAWGIYGLVSFAAWPAIIKIMSSMLHEKHKTLALLIVPFGLNFGTMLSYLTSAPILNGGTWRDLFRFTYITLAVFSVLFVLLTVYLRKQLSDAPSPVPMAEGGKPTRKYSTFKLMAVSGLFLLLLPNFVRGALDTGLKSWVPTMIMENYEVSPAFAGTLTVVLLVVNLLAIFLVAWMYPRRCRNAATAVGIYFAVTVPMTAVLLFTGHIPLAVVLIMLALVTTLMSASAQFFNASFAAAYAQYGKNGMIAGILNTAGCLGCVAANYGYGVVAEHFGWTATVGVWVALAAIAFVFCLLAIPKWARFQNGKTE